METLLKGQEDSNGCINYEGGLSRAGNLLGGHWDPRLPPLACQGCTHAAYSPFLFSIREAHHGQLNLSPQVRPRLPSIPALTFATSAALSLLVPLMPLSSKSLLPPPHLHQLQFQFASCCLARLLSTITCDPFALREPRGGHAGDSSSSIHDVDTSGLVLRRRGAHRDSCACSFSTTL